MAAAEKQRLAAEAERAQVARAEAERVAADKAAREREKQAAQRARKQSEAEKKSGSARPTAPVAGNLQTTSAPASAGTGRAATTAPTGARDRPRAKDRVTATRRRLVLGIAAAAVCTRHRRSTGVHSPRRGQRRGRRAQVFCSVELAHPRRSPEQRALGIRWLRNGGLGTGRRTRLRFNGVGAGAARNAPSSAVRRRRPTGSVLAMSEVVSASRSQHRMRRDPGRPPRSSAPLLRPRSYHRRAPCVRLFGSSKKKGRLSRPGREPGVAPSHSYTYAWLRCNAKGSGCTRIGGVRGRHTSCSRRTLAEESESKSARRALPVVRLCGRAPLQW